MQIQCAKKKRSSLSDNYSNLAGCNFGILEQDTIELYIDIFASNYDSNVSI
jgi:hypothetical protein